MDVTNIRKEERSKARLLGELLISKFAAGDLYRDFIFICSYICLSICKQSQQFSVVNYHFKAIEITVFHLICANLKAVHLLCSGFSFYGLLLLFAAK